MNNEQNSHNAISALYALVGHDVKFVTNDNSPQKGFLESIVSSPIKVGIPGESTQAGLPQAIKLRGSGYHQPLTNIKSIELA